MTHAAKQKSRHTVHNIQEIGYLYFKIYSNIESGDYHVSCRLRAEHQKKKMGSFRLKILPLQAVWITIDHQHTYIAL